MNNKLSITIYWGYDENEDIIFEEDEMRDEFRSKMDTLLEHSAMAKDEYNQLRKDDEDFAKQWSDNLDDFNEWFRDVYLPSVINN